MDQDPKIERLEIARNSLGLKKGEFASAMGIDPGYYTNIIKQTGRGNLRMEHLESLLKSHDINPSWIIA